MALVAQDGDLGVVASPDQGHEPGDLTGVNEGLKRISDSSHRLTLARHAHPALEPSAEGLPRALIRRSGARRSAHGSGGRLAHDAIVVRCSPCPPRWNQPN